MIFTFIPSILGIFIFGIIGGVSPCSCALNRGLVGYLTDRKANISPITVLKLIGAYSVGTVIMLLPIGIVTGLAGGFVVSWNSAVAFVLGGVTMFAMGLQLLRVYRLPLKSIYNALKQPEAYTISGTFILGLSFGLMTLGRGAPLLIILLTYIALYQAPLQGLVSVFAYAVGFTIMLFATGSIGGAYGEKAKHNIWRIGEAMGRVIGGLVLVVGAYFLYLAYLAFV